MAPLFTGCETHDLEVDYDYNRNVGIVVKNATGEDLLDPNVEDNILSDDITVEYNGETYLLSEDTGTHYFGDGPYLTIGPYSYGDKTTVLRFGAFRDEEEDRQFTINWGDGTSNEVVFNYTVTYETVVKKHDGRRERYNEAIWHYKIWVDGVLASGDSLIAEIRK